MQRKQLLLGLCLVVVSVIIVVLPFRVGIDVVDYPLIPLVALFCAFFGGFLVGKNLPVSRKRREWLAGLGVFISLIGGIFFLVVAFYSLPFLLIGGPLIGFSLPPAEKAVEGGIRGIRISPYRGKVIKKVIWALSLAMLVGGIVGSIYCLLKIDGLLDWAESIGDPKMTGMYRAYNYQVVAQAVRTLAGWAALSAAVAIAGGLSCLVWLSLLKRGWLRKAFFAFGAFLMLVGIPSFIIFHIQRVLETIQEFMLLFFFMSLISAGAFVLGALTCSACLFLPGSGRGVTKKSPEV